jgi:cysteine sulfinate desulfinase/cysteine desulfurase-like protein
MSSALAEFGNPSSVHSFGRAARRVVEDARRKVAALVAARPDDVVFTSGGTEANNLALRGSGRRRTLATAIEHPSVLEAADGIESVPVDGNGIVDLEALARTLEGADTPAIVSVMLANNETGVVLPVAEAARIAHRNGALFHCDAVQAAGRIALSMEALGADMLTLSAHKMGGPKGVGALIVSDRVQLHPIICGGGQERGRRSGTENLPGIAGFGAAAEVAAAGVDTAWAMASLRDRLEDLILRDVPQARIIGAGVQRLPKYVLCRAAGYLRRDPDHGARSGRFRGQCRLGVLLGQSEGEPRAAGHGPRRRDRRMCDPRQPRVRQRGGRNRRVRYGLRRFRRSGRHFGGIAGPTLQRPTPVGVRQSGPICICFSLEIRTELYMF